MKKLYCLLMLLVLTACSDEHVAPLIFGSNPWPGYEPAYVARELGYLDEAHVHLAEFTNTTEVVRAFRNGALQIAGLTLDEALSLRQSVPDLQVFMVVDISNGADLLMAKWDIVNLDQLKGKRIGVEKTALGAYFLSLILRAGHLSEKDIQIVSVPLDEHVEAYRTGLVDAVVTFGPIRGELSKLGAQVLFDSTKIPGKILDVLVIRAADADKHREHLHNFAKAWFRALHVIQNDPARSYPILTKHEQAQVSDIEETLRSLILLDKQQNLQQLFVDPSALLKTSAEIQSVLKENNLPTGSDDLSLFINSSIVTE